MNIKLSTERDHWMLVIDFLALAFDPETDLDNATAGAIDTLSDYGCATEDDEPNGDDDCSVEDEIDAIILRNRLVKRGKFTSISCATIEDWRLDPDVEHDDWDSASANDGPEETPAIMLLTEQQVRLFTARERSEERKAERYIKRIPSWNSVRFSPRSQILGKINGRSVTYFDFGRHVQTLRRRET